MVDLFSVKPPTWLDPLAEVFDSEQPEKYKKLNRNDKDLVFICNSYLALLNVSGISPLQIMWVVSNSCAETGWGEFFKRRNFGGWKVKIEDAKAVKKKTGASMKFYRAEGHQKSGDAPVVFYRAFDSSLDYYSEWIERYVPKNASAGHRYQHAGKRFWNLDSEWFREIVIAGYKGKDREKDPDGSVATFYQICDRQMKLFCQHMLGLTTDAVWGNKSKAAAAAFFSNNKNKQISGEFNLEIFEALFEKWVAEGKKIPHSILL